MTSRPSAFDPLQVFGAEFKLAGTVAIERCPVCGGGETARHILEASHAMTGHSHGTRCQNRYVAS